MAYKNNTQKIVLIALFTALVTVTTLVPHIPTPTFGYIHIGDGMVLLSGIFLGPLYGAFAAGVGSALSDAFTGYFTYVPATLVIKAVTALIAGTLFQRLKTFVTSEKKSAYLLRLLPAGVIAELFMVFGYFVYEIFLMAILAGGLSQATLLSGLASSASGVPFNLVQGAFGILLAAVLYPVLLPLIRRVYAEA